MTLSPVKHLLDSHIQIEQDVKVLSLSSRIYIVHDEVKDKAFELELSWVGEGKAPPYPACSHIGRIPLLLTFRIWTQDSVGLEACIIFFYCTLIDWSLNFNPTFSIGSTDSILECLLKISRSHFCRCVQCTCMYYSSGHLQKMPWPVEPYKWHFSWSPFTSY